MKKIAILGSTGSIGKSTLKVVSHLPEAFQVSVLAAHSNLSLLAEQIETYHPECVALYDREKAKELSARFPHLHVVSGPEGVEEAACHPSVDFVVVAIVGMQALPPTIRAIEAGKNIGFANKEVLVSAGEMIKKCAKRHNVSLLPIDSEHSAIFQCLEGKNLDELHRVILTSSGGPFRDYAPERLEDVSVEQALAHPSWKMGPKVTIDCSTLMNKGLEMIEAQVLFDLPPEKIDVIIHPQSVIHSMVEWIDGSVIAQMSTPDMIYPIQYALSYPERKPSLFPPFDFLQHNRLDFFFPDEKKFPALSLAREALKVRGSTPCFLNGANEVLVERFLQKEISWGGIITRLEKLMNRHRAIHLDSLDAVYSVDHEARLEARTV